MYDDIDDDLVYVVDDIEFIDEQISSLKEERMKLCEKVIFLTAHIHMGQRTYEVDESRNVEIVTKNNYRLDKKEYLNIRELLDFDVVKESVAYSIDKKLLSAYELVANAEALNEISQYVTETVAPHVVRVKFNKDQS